MNGHATQWIPAYHDGELSGARREWVQAHLESCETCRRELEQLEGLTNLLLQVPVPEQPSANRFVASVKLRLPHETQHQKRNRAFKMAWQLVPFAVIGGWALFQAVLIVSGIGLTFGLDRLLVTAVPSLESSGGLTLGGLFAGSLPALDQALLSQIEPVIELSLIGLVVTFVSAALLIGWMASWYAYRRSKGQSTAELSMS